MVGLSFALNQRVNALWSEDPAGDTARAEKLVDSALALQPDDALAHNAKAMVFFAKRQWKAAISQAEAALADDPNNASAHANLSFWNMFLGHSEDGFTGVETALRLSPRDPEVSSWQSPMCHLHAHLAQWEQAIEWCGKSIASGEASMFPYVDLAAANAWAGHDKEAKEAVAQLRKLYPDFTVQSWPASTGPTILPSTRNTPASSRAFARRGCRRGRRRRIEAPAGAGAMLVACRLADLSVLEGTRAGQSARAIRGGPEQGPCGGLSPKPPRHWRRRFLVGGRGDVEAAFSPSNAEGQHPPAAPDLAVLGHHRGPCSGFPERTLADRPTARYMLEPPSEGGRMNTVAPIRPVERPTGRLAIRRNAPGAASGRGPPSKSMTRRGGCFVSASAGGKPVAKRRQRPEPNWPASTSG